MSTSSEVQEECLLCSSQSSGSTDGAIFYDAIEGNDDGDIEPLGLLPETTMLLANGFHQLSLPIFIGDIGDGHKSNNYSNSEHLLYPERTVHGLQSKSTSPTPLQSAFLPACFIPSSFLRLTSENISVLPIVQSNFFKDTRQFSFQKSSTYSRKMRHLIETYQNGKRPIALNLDQLDDSREELNLDDSFTSTMRSASASDSDGLDSVSRYYVIDRETGKTYPLPKESSVLIRNAAVRSSVLQGCHHLENHSGKELLITPYPFVDEDSLMSGKRLSTVPCSFVDQNGAKNGSPSCDKFDEFTKHGPIELNVPLLPQHELIPDSIDDKPRCTIHFENLGAKHREGNQLSTNLLSQSRKRVVLPEHSIASGRVKCAAGTNFNMRLISKKHAHDGPIWIMKFSLCGTYFASAGKSGLILIWTVLPKNNEGNSLNPQTGAEDCSPLDKGVTGNRSDVCQFLSDEPIQQFEEHKGHNVVDLSWSKCNFLLSASLDKTVRLWHVSKSKSLRVFHHVDYVTSVDFNPTDDQYFLSGGFDKKIRVWSIATKRVKEWAQTPDLITAAKYSPDGKLVVAGMMKGQVYFYSAVEGLRYFTQISCRNRHGSKKDGRKVTGLQFRSVSNEDPHPDLGAAGAKGSALICNGDHGQRGSADKKWASRAKMLFSPLRFLRSKWPARRFSDQLLVTTNDGRMRLYGLGDFCLLSKFKGPKIPNMQISASFSGSGQNIICGSEDGRAYIWDSSTVRDLKVKLQKFVSHKQYNRIEYCARFCASETPAPLPSVVTETAFVPERVAKEAVIGSEISSLLTTQQDWSCAMAVTSDYEGNIKIFVQKHCLEIVAYSAC